MIGLPRHHRPACTVGPRSATAASARGYARGQWLQYGPARAHGMACPGRGDLPVQRDPRQLLQLHCRYPRQRQQRRRGWRNQNTNVHTCTHGSSSLRTHAAAAAAAAGAGGPAAGARGVVQTQAADWGGDGRTVLCAQPSTAPAARQVCGRARGRDDLNGGPGKCRVVAG